MKKTGWVIATALEVSKREIMFCVDESELLKNQPKFADLVGYNITIPQKLKFWKSELCKGSRYPITFNRTAEELVFGVGSEYVLLISRFNSDPVKLVGTGSKSDLYKLLGRGYSPANIRYCANIPFIEGSATGTLLEIISKLRRFYSGDPETYLTHEKTTWFIVTTNGQLKETIMPLLPSMVK
jgi:hypothetical protein